LNDMVKKYSFFLLSSFLDFSPLPKVFDNINYCWKLILSFCQFFFNFFFSSSSFLFFSSSLILSIFDRILFYRFSLKISGWKINKHTFRTFWSYKSVAFLSVSFIYSFPFCC
jgi:hypothetical protein